MIKINAETYISLGKEPFTEMVLSGWEVTYSSFLLIPIIIYKKKL